MKSRRLSWASILMTAMITVLVVALILSGCGQQAPTSTPTSKTLKIGIVTALEAPAFLDGARGAEAMADYINKKGGIVIGGETYNFQVLVYDSKGTAETAKSAVEKLISEENVKFILGDFTCVSWLPLTEANKVVSIVFDATDAVLQPTIKYAFNGIVSNTQVPLLWGWFADNYPNLKTVVTAYPDDISGRGMGELVKKAAELNGLQLTQLFFPATTTDFSAVATQVKTLNPDVFSAQYGAGASDPLCFKAVWQAGWRGQQFAASTLPVEFLLAAAPAEAIEGMIVGAWPTQLDNPPPIAKEFMDAYIEKYGKWESPEIVLTNQWYILMAGLKQADSIDPEKVAAVIGNGMEYESPCFYTSGLMIPRLDVGNTRTVDTLGDMPVKIIEGGKAKIIGTVSLDDAIKACNEFFAPK